MITAITLENFKGIGKPFRLPIRPLTLLFGPNGGGKSTIIQAIHYAREVLMRGTTDVNTTASTGGFAEIGGFRNFIHNHDEELPLRIRFEISLATDKLTRILRPNEAFPPTVLTFGGIGPNRELREEFGRSEFDVSEKLNSATVELTICQKHKGSYIHSYALDLNDEPFAKVTADFRTDRTESKLELNFDHTLFFGPTWGGKAETRLLERLDYGYKRTMSFAILDPSTPKNAFIDFDLELEFWARDGDREEILCAEDDVQHRTFRKVVSNLLRHPWRILRSHLEQFCYLGPFRDPPDREYSAPRVADSHRWAKGLAAWDEITRADDDFLNRINELISNPKGIDLGYEVHIEPFEKFGEIKKTVVLAKKNADGNGVRIYPIDTGVGVSQLIPIIVAALIEQGGMMAIEQPELHLHPRLQCEIGDVLIRGALGHYIEALGKHSRGFRPIIAETHSEHLILRILRRIRESSRGQLHNGIKVTPDDLTVCYYSEHK